MAFFTEVLAFLVVGDARYGREYTPLDRMSKQAERGLEFAEAMRSKKLPKKKEGK